VIQAGQTRSSGETLPKSYGTAVKDVSPFLLRGEVLSSFSVARHSIFASDQFPVSRVTGHWELADRHMSGQGVNQGLSPFGAMITIYRTAHLTETTEIRSALPATKSIQSQIAAVSSVRSLLGFHCFAELAAVACGSPK